MCRYRQNRSLSVGTFSVNGCQLRRPYVPYVFYVLLTFWDGYFGLVDVVADEVVADVKIKEMNGETSVDVLPVAVVVVAVDVVGKETGGKVVVVVFLALVQDVAPVVVVKEIGGKWIVFCLVLVLCPCLLLLLLLLLFL